jgi:hypothetical protein
MTIVPLESIISQLSSGYVVRHTFIETGPGAFRIGRRRIETPSMGFLLERAPQANGGVLQ